MDFGKYEKYMNDRKAVTVENNRRIEKKFAECEKWVADNLINCGCVFTNHSELLQKQSFMIWIDTALAFLIKYINFLNVVLPLLYCCLILSEYKNNPQGFIKPRGHFVYCIFCYFVFSTSVTTAGVVCCLFSM